jgi:2'-5' RNA ligase
MESIRAFVAIGLGEELKRTLLAVQRQLQAAPAARIVRWVAPENMHLTLKFLGDVETTRVPTCTTALHQSATGLAPFRLMARGLGCFPSTSRPNVIWVGLHGEATRAMELARRIEEAFATLGFPREARPFSPHLTLGRIKREARPSDRAVIGTVVQEFPISDLGIILADAVHFIKSDLRPAGPIYTTLATVHLDDSDDPLPRPS